MILAVKASLGWTHENPTDIEVMQRIIYGPMKELYFSWDYGASGPRLSGEILCRFLCDEIMSDMEKLQRMGVTGNVMFAQSHSKDPFIKCTLSAKGIVWSGTKMFYSDYSLDI